MKQRQLSWYMLLFQYPDIAEQWLSADGWANFREWCHHPDADAVIADLERNGSLTPALNYYRANIPPESYVAPPLELPAIKSPTMGVWSSNDFALVESQMTGSSAFVEGPWRYERRRPRPLDAARSARRGQPPAPRLPGPRIGGG